MAPRKTHTRSLVFAIISTVLLLPAEAYTIEATRRGDILSPSVMLSKRNLQDQCSVETDVVVKNIETDESNTVSFITIADYQTYCSGFPGTSEVNCDFRALQDSWDSGVCTRAGGQELLITTDICGVPLAIDSNDDSAVKVFDRIRLANVPLCAGNTCDVTTMTAYANNQNAAYGYRCATSNPIMTGNTSSATPSFGSMDLVRVSLIATLISAMLWST